MLVSRRSSVVSRAPQSPISAIQRPPSVAGLHARGTSDVMSLAAPADTDIRNVKVVLRVRPSDPDDASVPPRFRSVLLHPTSSTDIRIDVDPATLAGQTIVAPSSNRRHPTFGFDQVLGESASQVELYDATAKDTVEEFINGHNVTFLAYGQTSSGKSYSMGTTGEDSDYTGTVFNPRTGLIPRTVQHIFQRAEEVRQVSGPTAAWECRLSFLELYNEEMIDLLAGTGLSISIREERDGRIIWAGVREVRVKSLEAVMQLLYEGSARRKTGETGMNATSSRSHAIFSLTLVQKKKIGGPLAASASQPIASETPTPIRTLKRPSSTVGFPTSRSPTPSGNRPGAPPSSFSKPGAGVTRPNSVLGMNSSDDFVVVTSKFNMVDLAGSERLKRTAAQGDRMKEGISINSGLLALGNVISILSDPVKARGHIPYRDSKLTRMLQDSIGGNALTTMIACVSPIEYNIGETLNTIKYASRARNIKNSTKINAVEAGWDDVEHLQNTVLKLRKQVSAIEQSGGKVVNGIGALEEPSRGSEKLLQRLADLQREHTELYDRYLSKCSESLRLTSELRNARPGDGDALTKFNETVEPVILEYEKVVSALNQQLDELRLELTAISDLYEDQGRQLVEARERQSQSEAYVLELRGRVAKLSERNTSSEGYIHDLEVKLKTYSEKEESYSGVVGDLRNEVTKFKESNDRLNHHTTELEAQLAKVEVRSTGLLAQIEKNEREAEMREQAYQELERHIAVLDTTKDNKLLLKDIEAKDRRLIELEGLAAFHQRDAEERSRLLGVVDAEKAVQSQLRARPASMERSTSSNVSRQPSSFSSDDAEEVVVPARSPVVRYKELTPPESPSSQSRSNIQDDEITTLKTALRDLAMRCKEAEARHSQAEGRIADLTSQLSEAKLIHEEMDDIVPASAALPSLADGDEVSENGTTLQTPRGPSPILPLTTSNAGRRGSVPTPLTGTVKKDFRVGRGYGDQKRVRPQSLSQELSSVQSSATSPQAPWAGPNSLLFGTSPTRQSMPMIKPLRSPQSLEAELRFVHRVVEERDDELKDREEYIRQLEDRLREAHLIPSRTPNAVLKSSSVDGVVPEQVPEASNIPLPDSPVVSVVPIIHVDQDTGREKATKLSPQSVKRYSALKHSLSQLDSQSEAQSRIDDLLREMAVKEGSQREIIEQQFVQIAALQKANNRLRDELYEREPPRSAGLKALRKEVRSDEVTERAETPAVFTSAPSSPILASPSELNRLREEHAHELQAILKGHAESIEGLRREHSAVLGEMQQTFESTRTQYETDLARCRRDHERARAELEEKHAQAISASSRDNELLVEEMEKSLSSSEEQRRQLKMKADQAMFELSRVRDEHQLQRNGDLKQLGELQRANSQLEQVRSGLESANSELNKKLTELDQRYARKATALPPLPPQGPPPTTPLPPLPSSTSSPFFKSPGSEATASSFTHRTTGSNGSTALTSVEDIGAAMAQLPEPVGMVVQKVVSERDSAVLERESLKQQLALGDRKVKEADERVEDERGRVEGLNRELHESRKTNSKLRAHLEDSRQESKRLTEGCKEHMEELNERRGRMSKLSEESGHQRDSLLAAKAQVTQLKAQLDRAVEQKVNKKLLKSF